MDIAQDLAERSQEEIRVVFRQLLMGLQHIHATASCTATSSLKTSSWRKAPRSDWFCRARPLRWRALILAHVEIAVPTCTKPNTS
eukprot:g19542.t1